MSDFYITLHGEVDLGSKYPWIIVPPDTYIHLYNIPGYIFCTLFDFSQDKIKQSTPFLTYLPGTLMFNTFFFVDSEETELGRRKGHCFNRIANTTGSYRQGCIDEKIPTNGKWFGLDFLFREKPNVRDIHIYSCLPFVNIDNLQFRLPFIINQDKSTMYHETFLIFYLDDLKYNVIRKKNPFTAVTVLDKESRISCNPLIRSRFIYKSDGANYTFLFNDKNRKMFESIIQNSLRLKRVDDIKHGDIFMMVEIHKDHDLHVVDEPGIYSQTFSENKIRKAEEIIESFKPIYILDIINRFPGKMKQYIMEKYSKKRYHFSNKLIGDFFTNIYYRHY